MIGFQLSHLGEWRAVDHNTLSCHHDILGSLILLNMLMEIQLFIKKLLVVVLLLFIDVEICAIKIEQTMT